MKLRVCSIQWYRSLKKDIENNAPLSTVGSKISESCCLPYWGLQAVLWINHHISPSTVAASSCTEWPFCSTLPCGPSDGTKQLQPVTLYIYFLQEWENKILNIEGKQCSVWLNCFSKLVKLAAPRLCWGWKSLGVYKTLHTNKSFLS